MQVQKRRIDSSISIPVIHHKGIELQRLVAERAFGEQFWLVPGFCGEVEAGGLVIREIGIAGNGCDYFEYFIRVVAK